MTLDEIKLAIATGKRVFWATLNYEVIHDSIGQWMIWSRVNDHYIGLTWTDGTTVNGEPEQFFIHNDPSIRTHAECMDDKKWTNQQPAT